jgi:hypothetical protein
MEPLPLEKAKDSLRPLFPSVWLILAYAGLVCQIQSVFLYSQWVQGASGNLKRHQSAWGIWSRFCYPHRKVWLEASSTPIRRPVRRTGPSGMTLFGLLQADCSAGAGAPGLDELGMYMRRTSALEAHCMERPGVIRRTQLYSQGTSMWLSVGSNVA